MSTTTRRRVRPNDPDTSWEAAQAVDPNKSAALQAAIMRALRHHGPMNYDELIAHLEDEGLAVSASGVRTRTAELRTLGWVTMLREDGQVVKRPSDDGSPSIVWRACADGEVTGIDRHAVEAEHSDPAVDRFDLAHLRAALDDALRVYDSGVQAAIGQEEHVARLRTMADAAHAMADRLRATRRVVVVPSAHDSVTDAAAFGRNDRADRLW